MSKCLNLAILCYEKVLSLMKRPSLKDSSKELLQCSRPEMIIDCNNYGGNEGEEETKRRDGSEI